MAGENNKDFVDSCIDAKLRSGVYTALPGVITKVNRFTDRQVVNVRPLVGRLFQDGRYTEPPEILNASVVFPSAGGGLISFPVKIGDGVLLIFSMRDIDNWSIGNGVSPEKPNTTRHYSVNDAIAIPGLYTRSSNLSPDPDHVVIKFSGSNITLKNNGDVTASVAKDLIANVTGDVSVTTAGDATVTAVGKVEIQASTVSMNTTAGTGGVVTGECINPLTGTPYPDKSSQVYAGK